MPKDKEHDQDPKQSNQLNDKLFKDASYRRWLRDLQVDHRPANCTKHVLLRQVVCVEPATTRQCGTNKLTRKTVHSRNRVGQDAIQSRKLVIRDLH